MSIFFHFRLPECNSIRRGRPGWARPEIWFRIVHAVPSRVLHREPPKTPKTPRVVELLRKALKWRALLESGEVANQAAIARREGLTPACAEASAGRVRRPAISERALRLIAQLEDQAEQRSTFATLLDA